MKLINILQKEFPSLRYIETSNDDCFVIGKDLELLKGKSGDQFKRSYNNFIKTNYYKPFLFDVAPRIYTFKKDTLRIFKDKYKQKYSHSLGSINKIVTANSSATLNYLLEDKIEDVLSDISQSDNSLVKPILKKDKLISNYSYIDKNKDKHNQNKIIKKEINISENQIIKELASLSTYGSNPLRREFTILNTLKDQTVKTRRYDLFKEINDTIQIFEIKKNPLTTEHISMTLGEKGYLHLFDNKDNKSISFIFVAPFILPSAQRLISLIPNVSFISIDNLVLSIIKDIKTQLPNEGKWFLKRIIEEYQEVFSILEKIK